MLREGLIYSMVPPPGEKTARVRTVQSIQHRFLIDEQRAQRVKQLALQISIQMFDHWTFSNTASALLNIAIDLHEIS